MLKAKITLEDSFLNDIAELHKHFQFVERDIKIAEYLSTKECGEEGFLTYLNLFTKLKEMREIIKFNPKSLNQFQFEMEQNMFERIKAYYGKSILDTILKH